MVKRTVVTAPGDFLITRRLPLCPNAPFTRMVALIQSADAASTNMEMVPSRYEGTPVVESGGMNLSADPAVARDLQRIGFNLTAFCQQPYAQVRHEGRARHAAGAGGNGVRLRRCGAPPSRGAHTGVSGDHLEPDRCGRLCIHVCAWSPGRGAAGRRPGPTGAQSAAPSILSRRRPRAHGGDLTPSPGSSAG